MPAADLKRGYLKLCRSSLNWKRRISSRRSNVRSELCNSKDDASQTKHSLDCNIGEVSNNKENQSDEDNSYDENDDGETQVKGKEEQKQQIESQDEPYALSEYEQLRQRNIERNNARLKALGLFQPAAPNPRSTQKNRRPPRKKPKIVHEQRSHEDVCCVASSGKLYKENKVSTLIG